ncbi:uroporphyrinogen decarboxylase family protein [Filifactor villosus]|uniref:Uroporphyrinogen decarboxylase family protein n=1 Tax=Filifactor villosus TaxID=29374 RepID=A0ABV9QPS0_9FIRM
MKTYRDMTLLEYINSEDRVFFLPDMATNGLKFLGCTSYEVYEDPERQFELARRMNEEFESDFIYSFCDGAIFCETLGLELLKPDHDFPSVMSHPIQSVQDIRGLKVPDPYMDGRMPTNLKSLEKIASGIDKPLYVSIQGPFTLAVQLAGATHLLREIIRNPEFVEELLDFTFETVLAYAKAVNKVGAMYISISEPGTVTLSPENFKHYVTPRVNRIFDELTCWKGMHICGDTSHFLPLMLECRLDAVSLDQIMDYRRVMPLIPENIVLIGNLDPIELVGRGSVEEIEEETTKLCENMKKYRNFLCALGCNCLNDTPDENLRSAIRTARSYRKPAF